MEVGEALGVEHVLLIWQVVKYLNQINSINSVVLPASRPMVRARDDPIPTKSNHHPTILFVVPLKLTHRLKSKTLLNTTPQSNHHAPLL